MNGADASRAVETRELRDRGLEPLADEIRRHHKAVERHARSMVAEGVAAGEKLIEAKARLRHGEFLPFVRRCGISPRSAQLYMKLARGKCETDAHLEEAVTIREALEMLGGGREKKKKGEPRPKAWDWFFKGSDHPPLCYPPVYSRSVAVEEAERVLREQLRLCVGVRDGELVAQLRRRDLGDPSVEHDFGPLYSCNEALREEVPADELRALRDLVDAALRERGEESS
jgi:hypothetical protein